MICASVRSVDKKVTMTSPDTNIQLSTGHIVRPNSMTISQPSSSKSRERPGEMRLAQQVAANIRKLRYSHCSNGAWLSQAQVAKRMHVSANTVSRWETGVYEPTFTQLEKLATVLRCSVSRFFETAGRPAKGAKGER
jgi:DNA-binding XRE family transcriptional regulator